MSSTTVTTLTAHLGELAETLGRLRRRLRLAARLEVARAVGEALHEAALDLIGGRRLASASTAAYSRWDDAWHDPSDPWQAGPSSQRPRRPEPQRSVADMEPALLVALAAARWAFLRTGQVGPAALLGLILGLVAYAGGPAAETLLSIWSAANELLPRDHREP